MLNEIQIKKPEYFKLIFWVHLLFVILSYFSFLWLDWKVVVAGAVVLRIYHALRGGCDLTFIEFDKNSDVTFVGYYLKKIFPSIELKTSKFVVRNIVPIVVAGMAFIIQYIFGYIPIVNI